MRDLFVFGVVLVGLIATLRYPFAGILLWIWFTCMDPHEGTWGFAQSLQFNLVIAIVTILAWLLSKERKFPNLDAMQYLLFAFLAWTTINCFFAVAPDWSWIQWNHLWKVMLLGFLVSQMVTNKVRAHASVWAVAISLLYWGIKGGGFTLLTGGNHHVLGPKGSAIWDANELAVATLMVLPLANYLRTMSQNLWVSRGLLAGIALSTVSIVGSYSRGAFVALAGLSGVAWFRSRRKFLYPLVVIAVLVPIFMFMPHAYFDRLGTINSRDSDASFQGRVEAWTVAWRYATEHFPFGNGMSGSETDIFERYFPGHTHRSAHSIYFQVLGDSGFAGLALYISILASGFVLGARIRRATAGIKEFEWAHELAGMIQLSQFVFCLGGALLSLAYYDILFINIGLLSALRGQLARASLMNRMFSARALSPQANSAERISHAAE